VKRTYAITVYERKVEGTLTWTPLVPAGLIEPQSGKSEVRCASSSASCWPRRCASSSPISTSCSRPRRARACTTSRSISTCASAGGSAGASRSCSSRAGSPRPGSGCWCFTPPIRRPGSTPRTPHEAERLAPHFVRRAWRHDGSAAIEARKSVGKERLIQLGLELAPKTLLDRAQAARAGKQRAGLGQGASDRLAQLAIDQTARAIDGTLPLGVPRPTYRRQLRRLLGGERPRPTVLIGRPGSGRSTLLARWIGDRLDDDGWALHRNADRIHRVWRLAGQRLIAGMSYLGDWEERLLALVTEARRHRGILWFDDLHLFGRLGVTRQSERSFADFLHGPIQRGELVVVATATREQWARLEDDAPTFAHPVRAGRGRADRRGRHRGVAPGRGPSPRGRAPGRDPPVHAAHRHRAGGGALPVDGDARRGHRALAQGGGGAARRVGGAGRGHAGRRGGRGGARHRPGRAPDHARRAPRSRRGHAPTSRPGSSGKTRRSRSRPTSSCGSAPGSPTPAAPWACTCSPARPAPARPSWPPPWPATSTATSSAWSAST
jgi:hypothetical protein